MITLKKSNKPQSKEVAHHKQVCHTVLDNRHKSKRKTSYDSSERRRLTCEITLEHHRMLRIEAARTGRTIIKIVQELIEKNIII